MKEKHALLHEGTGHQVVSAFVEIVFDNSDNRIPVDREEVRLRRTVTLKKDEYFLNGKHVTKDEVMNLLESAGFSRSNPYYVVEQGKIANLTLMKDSERLDLLKEIAGARVYEELRSESLKKMQETGNKRKHIDQVVQHLEARLQELDTEKEELREYQKLDKQRRGLEYTFLDHELNEARNELTRIEEKRRVISENRSMAENKAEEIRIKIKESDKEVRNNTKIMNELREKKDGIEKKKNEALKAHAQIELDLRDLQERISNETRQKQDAIGKLHILREEIKKSKEELNSIQPSHQAKIAEEKEITKNIMDREKQLNNLYQKQGRATQFKSKAARDKWLQKEIDDLERVLSSNKNQDAKLLDEIQNLRDEEHNLEMRIEEKKAEANRLQSLMGIDKFNYATFRKKRDELQDKRKELWKEETELANEIDRLKSEIVKAQKSLDHAMPGDTRRGLNLVNRIAQIRGMKGVFGPILELIDCEEKFFTSVEVSAGNRLNNDDTSTQIISDLKAEEEGRLTFIPLNRVKVPDINYPQSPDVVPILKKLKFRSEYNPAFKQVFGRTVICRDLDTATKVAKTNGLDCITLEGDKVSKKGGMTGGYYDYRRSNEITKLVTRQQQMDADKDHERTELEQIKSDIANMTKQKLSYTKSLEKKQKSLANIRNQIEQIRAGISMKQAEMGTDLIDQLTPEEKHLLSRLNPEITELKEMLLHCKTRRIDIETRKEELETNLSTNLVRRQKELEVTIATADSNMLKIEENSNKQELNESKKTVDELIYELKQTTDEMDKLARNTEATKRSKEKLKEEEMKLEQIGREAARELEQLMDDRSGYLTKHADRMKKIRDLGSLPSDAFESYKRKNKKQLTQILYKCNEELKKFSHVNKKALDQYVSFLEQREQKQSERKIFDAGDEKIKELISVLDQRKDESIERTFKGVAKHFREIFSELVQGGHGELVMMRKKDGDDDDDEDGSHEPDPKGRIENFIGIKVKVSFTGRGETKSMKQLSGGQKTVVTLTLIFAIQRCDPAPFYLFDEIDAALDPKYRTSVSNMIRRLADMANTQFIATTFSPELVKVSDKIYSVTYENGVSHVNVV
ncbi:hypothetical protein LUZ60_008291 [Juncus effusus]|nr:hypothetical protein LUZ60_008291 [Juncus effusus]